MGTGGKSSHQAYDVAPTAGDASAAGDTTPAPAEPVHVAPAALTLIQQLTGEPISENPGATYGKLADAATELAASGAGPEELTEGHALTLAWLQQLSAEQLQQLAAGQGFTHPQLVGLSGKQPHPLVHVLDPHYPADSPSKMKIQQVANARYAALAAGETINGLTLADLPAPAPAGDGQWTATVAEVSGLQAQIATTLADISTASKAYTNLDHAQKVNTGFAELIALENKLATAACPDDPQALAAAQAAAAHSITQALDNGLIKPHLAIQLRQDLVDAGTLTSAEAGVLSTSQIIDVARPGTAAEQRAQLLELAGTRAGQLAQHHSLAEQHAALIGAKFSPYNEAHWAALDPAALTTMATLTGELYHTEEAILGWSTQKFVPVQGNDYTSVWPESYTHGFRKWAKTQPLGQLRQAATELGLEHADKATRAQVQNYIAGQWDSAQNTTEIQAAVTAKATAPPPAAPAASAASGTAATAPTVGELVGAKTTKPAATTPPKVTAKGSDWVAQHADLVAALKHHAASNSGLPQPMDSKVVAAWNFGKGTAAAHLGGTHSKSLHTGPDGKQWMFKRDSSGGARAAAEANAAAVFHAAGLPAVPVYQSTVNGKRGSVQPLLTQASPFPGSPKSWSQADADAIVRYHVAAWAVSNHDGHKDNLLRTPAGGMVAIDLGQAYKFCDQDKLSLSYNPAGTTVTHDLYQAHLGGKLAAGVTVNPAVAHPVLATIEKIPDAQWRSMLHDTAYAGAKADVPWTAGMRKRAAQSLGIAPQKVSAAQVAEAFLDAAVARKNGLRKAFTTFFTEELKLSSATALLSGR